MSDLAPAAGVVAAVAAAAAAERTVALARELYRRSHVTRLRAIQLTVSGLSAALAWEVLERTLAREDRLRELLGDALSRTRLALVALACGEVEHVDGTVPEWRDRWEAATGETDAILAALVRDLVAAGAVDPLEGD